MRNEHKIALIKHYISQPNCVGVEVEWANQRSCLTFKHVLTADCNNNENIFYIDGLIEVNFNDNLKIIGNPKPIAIELDDLKVGDRVWANGRMGEVEDFTLGSYDVSFNEDDWGEFERHELIKVMK